MNKTTTLETAASFLKSFPEKINETAPGNNIQDPGSNVIQNILNYSKALKAIHSSKSGIILSVMN